MSRFGVRAFSHALAAGALGAAFAAVPARAGEASGPTLDPAIVAAAGDVSPARLKTIDEQLVGFGTRNLLSERLGSRTRGVYAARDAIAARFRAIAARTGGRMTVAFDTFEHAKTDHLPRAVEVSSVIATLRGDDPERGTIVLSSHYDSRNSDANDATRDAPGADDNGSGTACVLEAARVLAALPLHATVVFATFDGEEQGLFGSEHFAKVLKDRGTVVEANLNNDIVGASIGHAGQNAPNDVRLFSESLPKGADPARVNLLGSENDSPARELARFVKEIAEAYVAPMHANLIYRSDRFLRGGDQESFAEQGYPAVRFVEQNENFDHQHQNVRVEGGVQYGDLVRFVDFDYLARVTRMNVAAITTLALAPAEPVPRMVVRDLGYDTTLVWKPVPRAASYEVVWRATFEPLWTHLAPVLNATSYTAVGVSKDDFIFGVRALDADGHAGVVAYPLPERRSE
ncbi:MAG: M20/M25/M40 family metallo-hydrolase [Candidatus Baltobacteraceae bacterium]